MAYRLFPLFCLGLLLLAACDSVGENDPPIEEIPPATEVIRPLAVGNYWAYTSKYFVFDPDTFRVEITRNVEFDYQGRRVRAYAQQLFRPDGTPYSASDDLVANGEEGLYGWGRMAETDTLLVRQVLQKYPAEVGDTWPLIRVGFDRWTGEHAVFDTLQQTLIATDEEIEVPAGTFRCYVYKYTFRPGEDVASLWNVYDYFAPGVRNVAQIIRSQGPGEPESETNKAEVFLYDYRVE